MTKQAKPKAPVDVEVTVQFPNIWTSKGKFLQGDKVTLPASEAKSLGDAVK